jgi:hypothetical protein
MWEPRRLTTLWASTACYWDSFTFLFFMYVFYNTCSPIYIQLLTELIFAPFIILKTSYAYILPHLAVLSVAQVLQRRLIE